MNFDRISPSAYSVYSYKKNITPKADTHSKYTYVYKLIVILEGSMLFCSGDTETWCEAGDVIYIPACCVYSTSFPCEVFSSINIEFDMVYGGENVPRFRKHNFILVSQPKEEGRSAAVVKFDDRQEFNKSFVMEHLSGAIEIARRCLELFNSRATFSLLFLNIQIVEFLIKIAKARKHSDSKAPARIIYDQVVKYIHKHCKERLTCTKVAEDFSYHPASLNRIVRENAGMSLHRVIVCAKVDEAIRLLLETDLSIAEIAQQLSFYDSSHFTKTFCDITGRSPSSFRKIGI